MKKMTRVLALVATLFPLFAAAQLRQSERIVTKVPFEFVVGNKTVPAGEWMIRSAVDGGRTLAINNQGEHLSAFANVSTSETKEPAASYALVFHKYGDRYFLVGMKLEGSTIQYGFPESKGESEMRARNMAPTEEILLASLK